MRFLAATSADLEAAVRAAQLRPDLYYRLRGVELRVPPLRERQGDIPLLARRFLELHAERTERPVPSLDDDAVRLLERHDWPGNVRELETVLLRAFLEVSPGAAIGLREVAPLLESSSRHAPRASLLERDLDELRRDLERTYLLQLHAATGGDLEAMMAKLKVRRTKLYAWMRRLGIDVRKLRD